MDGVGALGTPARASTLARHNDESGGSRREDEKSERGTPSARYRSEAPDHPSGAGVTGPRDRALYTQQGESDQGGLCLVCSPGGSHLDRDRHLKVLALTRSRETVPLPGKKFEAEASTCS